jgi:plastocyanin
MITRPTLALATASLALLLAACGGSDDPTGTTGTTGTPNPGGGSTSNAVSVRDNSFSPNATTVAPGTTVTWTWSGNNPHDVTFTDGTASAVQRAGTYQRTFAAAGTFAYQCSIHGASMSGTITVR